MTRLGPAFRQHGHGRLICFLTAGFPNMSDFKEHFHACVEGGADIMEIGLPFSDPVADGPTIQHASRVALEKGATLHSILEVIRELRQEFGVPMVLMGYYNPIFVRGLGRFVDEAKSAGADGLIVPDVPLEECDPLRKECERGGLDLIMIAGPLTSADRMKRIASASSGYLYLAGNLGTTGARTLMSGDLPKLIKRAKASTELPVAVGFGISDPDQVRNVIQAGADGAIVGSAILDLIINGSPSKEVRHFVETLKEGV